MSVLARSMARAAFSPLVRRRLLRMGDYRLRCVLFHDVVDEESAFTRGLNVTVSRSEFLAQVEFLAAHYTLVPFESVLEDGARLDTGSKPPLLITFDDAYRSVVDFCAPRLHELGVPSLFFVNGEFVGNRTLALDNLLSYVINTSGLTVIERAAARPLANPRAIWNSYLPTITPADRARFKREVADTAGIDIATLAQTARLYVDEAGIASLPALGMEIGNHTFSHLHCRTLDAQSCDREIGHNREVLEGMVSAPVRAFSFPYGHRADATPVVRHELERTGTKAAFLVHALPNTDDTDRYGYHRVSLHAGDNVDTFSAVEVLPRLRLLRNRLRRGDVR